VAGSMAETYAGKWGIPFIAGKPGDPTPTPDPSSDPGEPTPTPDPSDVPDEPSSTKKPKPTPPPEKPKLPQTGQLWWPIPMLVCAGLLLIIIGLLRRRR
jgi:LPXTG-motif cell wall-anchored protein